MKVKGQLEVELQETMGSDRSIAEAAWTSSSDYQKKKKRDDKDVEKVVTMLANNRHATPFESVVFRFWIKMPIQTDRQFMTHRIASHSGMSGRYRTMPSEFLHLPPDCQDILKKMPDLDDAITKSYYDVCKSSNAMYSNTIFSLKEQEKEGVITNAEYKRLREMIRGILPQNNMTERVSVMNLRSFANFQKLRNSEHAQLEIREIAQLMLEEVEEKSMCPTAINWLKTNGWNL